MRNPFGLFLPIVLCSFSLSAALYSQVEFGETVHADDDSTVVSTEWLPSAALGPDGNLWTVWSREGDDRTEIFIASKAPEESTFTTGLRVKAAAASTRQRDPSLTVNGSGDVLVVWQEESPSAWKILFARKPAGQPAFDPAVTVSDDTTRTERLEPVIVAFGDSLAVFWEDHRAEEGDIFGSASLDGGETFSANVRVNDDIPGTSQGSPDAAVDMAGTVYVAWEDDRQGFPIVYMAKNEDWGQHFSNNVPVVDTSLALEQRAPSLATGPGGCVSVAWWDVDFLSRSVRYAKSCDGGQTFSLPVTAYSGMFEGPYFFTDVAVDGGGRIHLCYNAAGDLITVQCYEVYGTTGRVEYAVSSDSGETFADLDVTGHPAHHDVLDVRSPTVLPGDNGAVHFVWADSRLGNSAQDGGLVPYGFDIFSSTVLADTVAGTALRVNSDPVPYRHTRPSVALGGDGSLFLCWADVRTGPYRINCAMSPDSGGTFGPSVPVAESPEGMEQQRSVIDVSPAGELQVAWVEQDGNGRGGIFFAKTDDISSGFTDPVQVSDRLDLRIESFRMETDVLGHVNVIWSDSRNEGGDLYFARSSDGGSSFSTAVRVNGDEGSAGQWSPDIATDPWGDAYAVWIDTRESGNDIYFARTSGGEPIFVDEKKVNSAPLPRAFYPAIDLDEEGKIYVMWHTSPSIFISTSADGGETFTDMRIVAAGYSSGDPESGRLLASHGSVVFLWGFNDFFDFCSYHDVMLNASTDGGISFSENIAVSDDSTRHATYPDFDVDSEGNLLVVWADPRRDAYSIYHEYDPSTELDHIFCRRGAVAAGIEDGGEITGLPRSYRFFQNYPNPFNPVTTIRYDLPRESAPAVRVSLRIYSLRGEPVRTLVDAVEPPGSYLVVWNGKDDRGGRVGSGVYFSRMEAGRFTAVKKMILLR